MTDAWLYVVAVLLIVAVPFDVLVAGIFIGVSLVKPRIGLLTLLAFALSFFAAIAVIGGVLGGHSVVFNLTEGQVRLLPAPIPTLLLVMAMVGASIPPIAALVWLIVRERRALVDDKS